MNSFFLLIIGSIAWIYGTSSEHLETTVWGPLETTTFPHWKMRNRSYIIEIRNVGEVISFAERRSLLRILKHFHDSRSKVSLWTSLLLLLSNFRSVECRIKYACFT